MRLQKQTNCPVDIEAMMSPLQQISKPRALLAIQQGGVTGIASEPKGREI
jgi:hypothetical protein